MIRSRVEDKVLSFSTQSRSVLERELQLLIAVHSNARMDSCSSAFALLPNADARHDSLRRRVASCPVASHASHGMGISTSFVQGVWNPRPRNANHKCVKTSLDAPLVQPSPEAQVYIIAGAQYLWSTFCKTLVLNFRGPMLHLLQGI